MNERQVESEWGDWAQRELKGLDCDKKDEAPRLVSAGVSGVRVDDGIARVRRAGTEAAICDLPMGRFTRVECK
jgi:hypothetical protein